MRRLKWSVFFLGLLAIGLVGMGGGLAQRGDGFTLPWYTVDGGGATSSGGMFAVAGSLGQADTSSMAAGIYGLAGGFWPGAQGVAPLPHAIYLPTILKSPEGPHRLFRQT